MVFMNCAYSSPRDREYRRVSRTLSLVSPGTPSMKKPRGRIPSSLAARRTSRVLDVSRRLPIVRRRSWLGVSIPT